MNKNPKSALKAVNKDKFKHGSMALAFSVIFIALVIVLNVLVSALTVRFPSLNFDMTVEGLNTLSEESLEVVKGISEDTRIYIIGSEDKIRGDEVYSGYGLKYSQVANIIDRLREANGKISVEYIDPDLNPGFISAYSEQTLRSGDVMVQTDRRTKVLSVTDLFSIQQDSQTGEYLYFSKVDGALANALYLVNLESVPKVALATGHGEMLTAASNLSSFVALLEDNNFTVEEFNILSDEIPEETSVVFIGTPTTDYTTEEIAKLQEFLKDDTVSHTLYVTAYPSQGWDSMPNLKSFLEEWGLRPTTELVLETNPDNVLSVGNGSMSYVFSQIAKYDTDGDGEDDGAILTGSYPYLVMTAATKVEKTFEANNEIVTYDVVVTADTAYSTSDGTVPEEPETGVQPIVVMAQRYNNNTGSVRASIVLDGCSSNFTPNYIASNTFSNKTYTTDLFKNLTDSQDNRIGLSVKQTQTNTADITVSASTIQWVGLYIFTIAVPVAILVVGLVIFLKRRHL